MFSKKKVNVKHKHINNKGLFGINSKARKNIALYLSLGALSYPKAPQQMASSLEFLLLDTCKMTTNKRDPF